MAAFCGLPNGQRIIVDLPSAPLDDLLVAGEILLQEGLSLWTVAAAHIDTMIRLQPFFAGRAHLGVRHVLRADQVRAAAAAGAELVLSAVADQAMVAAARSAGLVCVVGALTPQEIFRAASLAADAVQVIPFDALGQGYLATLQGLIPDVPLVATGEMTAGLAAQLLLLGVVAVSPAGIVQKTMLAQAELPGLRETARAFQVATMQVR